MVEKRGEGEAGEGDVSVKTGSEKPDSGSVVGDTEKTGATRGNIPRVAGPLLVVAAVLVLVIPLGGLFLLLSADTTKPKTYSYTIPAGTSEKLAKGEQVTIMPAELNLKVGDRLVIHNDDNQLQTVGLFTVRPGETVDTPFNQTGVFKGQCSMSGGQLTINVT